MQPLPGRYDEWMCGVAVAGAIKLAAVGGGGLPGADDMVEFNSRLVCSSAVLWCQRQIVDIFRNILSGSKHIYFQNTFSVKPDCHSCI